MPSAADSESSGPSGFQSSNHRLAPNFDRLARPYRWLEYLSFGPFLQRARLHYLPQLAGRGRALVLGDGDGRFTARLLRACPGLHVEAVDASQAMLESLRRRSGGDAGRVTTCCADIRSWQPEPGTSYDLIATHFFLDCLSSAEVAQLAQRVGRQAELRALWIFSDFAIPATGIGRAAAAGIVWFLYKAFGWLTGLEIQGLPDHAAGLESAGFRRIGSRARLGGLLVSELWQRREPPTLQDVERVGNDSAAAQRRK
jgi:SAM-dependent methyltransferase